MGIKMEHASPIIKISSRIIHDNFGCEIIDDRRTMMGKFVTLRIVLDWALGDKVRAAVCEEDY